MNYSELKKDAIFGFFEEINNIPRESGNEQAISDYLVDFGKKRGFYVRQDESNNVVIKKPGTKGYEDKAAVIIQGHMDMVCVKENGSDHDFAKDPIKMYVDGDFVKAEGTTLGADNGIAVAMGLALLDADNIVHPPLELVVTTDEEVGLTGAIAMDAFDLEGKYFINLDSEEEGEFTVSCAGGIRITLVQTIDYLEADTTGKVAKDIIISGLCGGHSGVEIDTNRANGVKLLGRVLNEVNKSVSFDLVAVDGGVKDNVIPSYAKASILVNEGDLEALNGIANDLEVAIVNEYKTSDKDIKITVEGSEATPSKVLNDKSKDEAIFLLVSLPNGIQAMSNDIEGLVESSLNIGVLKTEENKVSYQFALRSSVRSYKYYMVDVLENYAKQFNLEVERYGDYPEWPFKLNSSLEQKCCEVYKNMYGKEPVVKGIHAGLEGGVFLEKMPHIEAISIGPNMSEVHSPNERVSISSIKRVNEFLLEVLKEL